MKGRPWYLLLFCAFIMPTFAADFSWTPPTHYSDGTPVQTGDIQKFTVYCRQGGTQNWNLLFTADGDATSAKHDPCVASGTNEFVITAWGRDLQVAGVYRESPTSDIYYLDTSPASLNKTQLTCQPCLICDVPVPPPPTAEIWAVANWGSRLNWDVFAIGNDGKRTDTVIGNLDSGIPCGEFVEPYRNWANWSWRKVTIQSSTGPDLVGVTVCKKQ